jgi:alkanesulfonate monooxygenase SsuD/methylene tetrahydromethanopterin reductase-like flavin-dependent oxidoreductase (luciferase family)
MLLKKLWTGKPVTHKGRFYQTNDLFVSPQPVQKPHPPIWFGSHGEPALKRAARLGDGWMEAGARSTKTLQKEMQLLKQFLIEEGRDITDFTFSKRVIIAVDKDRETALKTLEEWFIAHGEPAEHAKEIAVFGTPDDCIEGLAGVAATGVDMIALEPVYDYEGQAERLAKEVLPGI